jgi:Ca2+-binding RTX toxin-like protein
MIENLENRRLYSVSLVNGTLSITGSTAGEAVWVTQNGATTSVSLSSESAAGTRNFATSAIQRINVDLGAGNDALHAETVTKPTTVFGGDGNDRILTGAASDYVSAGRGDDIVSTYDGVDTIHGGDGNDTISGGNGNDYIYGEAGDDRLSGNAGNDAVYGGDGNDNLYGNGGKDFLYGQAGSDYFSEPGDGQGDYIDGGTGTDSIGLHEKSDVVVSIP